MDVARGEVPESKKAKLQRSVAPAKLQVHSSSKVQEHPLGITVQEALGVSEAVAARLNNEVVPLSTRIVGTEAHLEAIPLASSDGIRVLVETLKFLLKVAKHECSPDLAITIGRPIGSAYYCVLTDRTTGSPHLPTEELLQRFQNQIRSLVESAEPLQYMHVCTKDAIEIMSKTGAGLTAKMLKDCPAAQMEVVECRGVYHLPRVPIMPNTSLVPKDGFKLTPFKDGFFLEHWRCDTKTGEASYGLYGKAASDLLYNEYVARMQWSRDVELQTVAELNAAIRSGRQKNIIQAVEANVDRQFVELASQVRSRGNVKLLLIAGPTSSGKTTFAKRLQVQLESLGHKPLVLSVDNFYRAWQDITPEGPHKVDWESLDSLNLGQLNEVLLTLLAGKEALIPEYDMKTSIPVDKSHWTSMKLPPGGKGIVIMEGIHCLNPALTPAVPKEHKFQIAIAPIPALQLDACHVLSGTTIRMLRRMVRDYLNRGRPVLSTLRQWPAVVQGEVNNIYPHQSNADAVMNSEIGYEMCVLKVHVEPLLKTIGSSEREYSEVRRLLDVLELFIALPTNIIPPQSLLREFVGGSWYYDYGGWYKGY